jgi:hypothetical protein
MGDKQNASGKSLGLAGDGDEVDLIDSVEKSFGVKFTDEELARISTMGDLYEALVRHLPNTESARRRHCRSATAFRRMQSTLRTMTNDEVRPSTDFSKLVGDRSFRDFVRQLELGSGLSLGANALRGSAFFVCASISSVAAICYFVLTVNFSTFGFLATLAMSLVGAIFGTIVLLALAAVLMGDRIQGFDRDVATVGDLAQRAVHLNFADLTSANAQHHPSDVWKSLDWLARQETDYKGPIDRDTRLIGM